MGYENLPIPDRGVPGSRNEVLNLVSRLVELLTQGRNVAIHCRGGLGRSPMIAACLLASAGVNPDIAFGMVGAKRGGPVPETKEQHDWVVDFARELSPASPIPALK